MKTKHHILKLQDAAKAVLRRTFTAKNAYIKKTNIGREVGGGSMMVTHVNPWLIHVTVWQNPLQYYKVISLQLIKINEKIYIKN